MSRRLQCSLGGLACLAVILGAVPRAFGEEATAERVEIAPGRGGGEADVEAGEREYIAHLPNVERPELCQPELQGQIRIAGTVYDSRRPERSMALIGAANSPATGLYRAGSRYGRLQLLEVRPHAVLLSSDHEESPCWLKMERPDPNAPKPAAAASQAASDKKKERKKVFTSDELARDIQQIGPGVYSVSRSIMDRAIARAPSLARTIRTRTVKKDGVRVGVALARIESGGLFEHLGLKKGDVLRTVNGFDMTSIDGMLSARTQLVSAPRLSLALERGGQPVTLEYRLH